MKNVLITGAARGIGKAITEKFLKEGYIVYGAFYKSKKQIMEMQKKYGKDRLKILGPYDLRKIDQIDTLIDKILGIEFDTFVMNAGVFSENDDFVSFDLNDFNEVMNCNFYAPLMICTKMKSYIKSNGSIILMSSNDAYSGAYGSMSYSISKSAIISLMKCLCVNYGRRRIRVNSVAPGAINTDMNTPEQEFEAPLYTPIKRIAQPYEVANVVYFLTTQEASFINGENITIDGGYSQVSTLLKSEIERNRKIAGYKYLNEKFLSLNANCNAYCMDSAPEYGWINKKDEIQYIENNIYAMKNGANIIRIIIVNKEKYNKIVNNETVKYNYFNLVNKGKMYQVKEEEIKKKFLTDYRKIGKGYIVFETNDLSDMEVFIDSYNNDDEIGYVIKNEMIGKQLKESFFNILNAVETGEIESIKLKKHRKFM